MLRAYASAAALGSKCALMSDGVAEASGGLDDVEELGLAVAARQEHGNVEAHVAARERVSLAARASRSQLGPRRRCRARECAGRRACTTQWPKSLAWLMRRPKRLE